MNEKICLLTDIGSDIDDALALDAILNHPGIDLATVVTVNGDVDSRALIAKRMVDLHGRDIAVCRGTSLSLSAIEPYKHFEDCMVDDAYIDLEKMDEEHSPNLIYKPFRKIGIKQDGVDYLAKCLRGNQCIIFSIGPMTDIAMLLKRYPEVIGNIKMIYVMGCEFREFRLEHNLRFDAVAANIVFQSSIPLTIVPANICSQYRMRISLLEGLKKSDCGNYVYDMAMAYIGIKFVLNCQGLNFFGKSIIRAMEEAVERESCRYSKEVWLFVRNMDAYSAAFEKRQFMKNLEEFIVGLGNPDLRIKDGPRLADVLKSLIPKTIYISDVFIPYCFVNRSRLEISRKTVACDSNGVSVVLPGNKHEVVEKIDYEDFENFVCQYCI